MAQLRDEYGHDHKRYFQAYEPGEEDFIFFQEMGMEAFMRLEEKMLRQMRTFPYRLSAQASLESFAATMAGELATVDLNIVFISLDFEGTLDDKESMSLVYPSLTHAPFYRPLTMQLSTPSTLH